MDTARRDCTKSQSSTLLSVVSAHLPFLCLLRGCSPTIALDDDSYAYKITLNRCIHWLFQIIRRDHRYAERCKYGLQLIKTFKIIIFRKLFSEPGPQEKLVFVKLVRFVSLAGAKVYAGWIRDRVRTLGRRVTIAIAMRVSTRVPDKIKLIQCLDSLQRNMAAFAIFEASTLPSLMMHPSSKLRIVCVIRGYGTAPVLLLVVGEFP
jgi:hypothetical protein